MNPLKKSSPLSVGGNDVAPSNTTNPLSNSTPLPGAWDSRTVLPDESASSARYPGLFPGRAANYQFSQIASNLFQNFDLTRDYGNQIAEEAEQKYQYYQDPSLTLTGDGGVLDELQQGKWGDALSTTGRGFADVALPSFLAYGAALAPSAAVAVTSPATAAVAGTLAAPVFLSEAQRIAEEVKARDGMEGQQPTWGERAAVAPAAALNVVGERLGAKIPFLDVPGIDSAAGKFAARAGTEPATEFVQGSAEEANVQAASNSPMNWGEVAKQGLEEAYFTGPLGVGQATAGVGIDALRRDSTVSPFTPPPEVPPAVDNTTAQLAQTQAAEQAPLAPTNFEVGANQAEVDALGLGGGITNATEAEARELAEQEANQVTAEEALAAQEVAQTEEALAAQGAVQPQRVVVADERVKPLAVKQTNEILDGYNTDVPVTLIYDEGGDYGTFEVDEGGNARITINTAVVKGKKELAETIAEELGAHAALRTGVFKNEAELQGYFNEVYKNNKAKIDAWAEENGYADFDGPGRAEEWAVDAKGVRSEIADFAAGKKKGLNKIAKGYINAVIVALQRLTGKKYTQRQAANVVLKASENVIAPKNDNTNTKPEAKPQATAKTEEKVEAKKESEPESEPEVEEPENSDKNLTKAEPLSQTDQERERNAEDDPDVAIADAEEKAPTKTKAKKEKPKAKLSDSQKEIADAFGVVVDEDGNVDLDNPDAKADLREVLDDPDISDKEKADYVAVFKAIPVKRSRKTQWPFTSMNDQTPAPATGTQRKVPKPPIGAMKHLDGFQWRYLEGKARDAGMPVEEFEEARNEAFKSNIIKIYKHVDKVLSKHDGKIEVLYDKPVPHKKSINSVYVHMRLKDNPEQEAHIRISDHVSDFYEYVQDEFFPTAIFSHAQNPNYDITSDLDRIDRLVNALLDEKLHGMSALQAAIDLKITDGFWVKGVSATEKFHGKPAHDKERQFKFVYQTGARPENLYGKKRVIALDTLTYKKLVGSKGAAELFAQPDGEGGYVPHKFATPVDVEIGSVVRKRTGKAEEGFEVGVYRDMPFVYADELLSIERHLERQPEYNYPQSNIFEAIESWVQEGNTGELEEVRDEKNYADYQKDLIKEFEKLGIVDDDGNITALRIENYFGEGWEEGNSFASFSVFNDWGMIGRWGATADTDPKAKSERGGMEDPRIRLSDKPQSLLIRKIPVENIVALGNPYEGEIIVDSLAVKRLRKAPIEINSREDMRDPMGHKIGDVRLVKVNGGIRHNRVWNGKVWEKYTKSPKDVARRLWGGDKERRISPANTKAKKIVRYRKAKRFQKVTKIDSSNIGKWFFDAVITRKGDLFTENFRKNAGELIGRQATAFNDWLVTRTNGKIDISTMGNKSVSGLAGLKDKNAYLKGRYETMGKVLQIGEFAREVYDLFGSNKAEHEAIYKFLVDEGPIEDVKDQKSAQLAEKVKRRISKNAETLIKYGMLPADTTATIGYLPRMYLKYVLAEGDYNTLGMGGSLSAQNYTKKRTLDPSKEDDKRIMEMLGEITDPGFLGATTLSQVGSDIAIFEFLQVIAESTGSEWVLENSLVEVAYMTENNAEGKIGLAEITPELKKKGLKGTKVSPFWLRQEADGLRKRAQYMEEKHKANAINVAEYMDKIADKHDVISNQDLKRYRQVPKSKKFGRVAGSWVDKRIYDDLFGARTQSGSSTYRAAVKIHGWWKTSKVPLNPPTWARNIMSNIVLMNLSGVPVNKAVSYSFKGAMQMKEGKHGRAYKVGKKYGLQLGTFSHQELNVIQKEFKAISDKQNPYMIVNAFKAAGKGLGWTAEMYSKIEIAMKVGLIEYHLDQGKTEWEAFLEAQEALFDYSLMNSSLRKFRKAPVGAPFISFFALAGSRFVKVATTNPLRLAVWFLAVDMMWRAAANAFDVDDDDLKKVQEGLPDYLREKLAGMIAPVPWRDSEGRLQFVDLAYMHPWGAHAETAKSIATADVPTLFQNTGIGGAPALQLLSTIITGGVNPFTKQNVTEPEYSDWRKSADWLTFLYQMATPSILNDMGAPLKMYKALFTDNVKTNKLEYGEPGYTPMQSMMRLFGINTYPVDPEMTVIKNLQQMKYRQIEKKSAYQRLLRGVYISNDMSPEEQKKRREKRAKIELEFRMEMAELEAEMREMAELRKVHPNLKVKDIPDE